MRRSILFCCTWMVLLPCMRASAGDLLVANDGFTQDGILRFDGSSGAFVGRFLDIDRPISMTYGPDGNLYVGSLSLRSINRYNGQTGAFIDTFVTTGSGGLEVPWDMQFGADGNLYVAMTSGSTQGGVLRYSGTTGQFIDRFIDAPALGLAFGPDGNLYVSRNQAVGRYSSVDGSSLGDFVAANDRIIQDPYHLKFGPDGNLYVANASATAGIRRYDGISGAFLGDFATPPFPSPSLFAAFEVIFGPNGNLYMGNGLGSEILQFDGTTGTPLGQFVAPGSGGLHQTRSMVFMIPEPGMLLSLGAITFALARRGRLRRG